MQQDSSAFREEPGSSSSQAANPLGREATAEEPAQDPRASFKHWKRNLAVMWVTQFVTVIGFSLAFPFIPLYVKELGVEDPGQAAFWAGIGGGAMGLSMFFFGPIWGMLGDRYGRKKNVLRAILGSAVFLALNGLATNVYQLTGIRFVAGVVSGVFAPVMALTAATLPKERILFGIGALQAAMFLGNTVGPALGGLLAATAGFGATFFYGGAVVGAAGILVLFLARENFQRPAEAGPVLHFKAFEGMVRLLGSKQLGPILATIFVVQISPMLMFVVLPVLLDNLAPGSGASATGVAFAILGLAGALGAYSAGWFSGRLPLTRTLAISCIGAGVFSLPLMFLESIPLLYLSLALVGVFQGVLAGVTSGLISMAVPPERQGTGFGALQSLSAGAFGFGPLVGGTIAATTGIRSVFLAQAIGLFAAAVLVVWLLGGRRQEKQGPGGAS